MKLLHEVLVDSASVHAQKKALVFKDANLSYRDLDQISSRLASLMGDHGIGVGDRIGVYMDKSIDVIIALFGVLKIGACYVPLDPMAPPARLNLIAIDCELEYLVTASPKLKQVTAIASKSKNLKSVFILDKQRKEIAVDIPGINLFFRDDVDNSLINISSVPGHLTPESLAYILYTSGSTGQPKGVMVSHRAALAFVDWSLRTFKIGCDDIVSAHAPLHFDLSIFDIYVSIRAGATICIIPQGWSAFPRTIADFIEGNKISTWYSVPSALIQLVLHGNLAERQFPALKRILFAGEVFPSKYLRELMELVPETEYYNLYGPTETNVITYYHVQEPPAADTIIPIGSLCAGVKSFIVSDSRKIVNKGEVGELYVECPTLMDGYWRDKQKTQTVLQNNPYDPLQKNLLYKTGDLVHLNEEGCLVFHGRCDAMIKSRGYRIELGEIESVLSTHTGIKEVAVTAVPDDEVGNRIKAIIVPESHDQVSEKDIYRFCSKKLPAYMVPDIIRSIAALPRTSTGKIDRKKISSPDI